jgi:aminopeptidase
VVGTPLARPLLEEVERQIARRGAHASVQLRFVLSVASSHMWLKEAPLDLVGTPSAIERYALEHCDALIVVDAPENTRDRSEISAERLGAVQSAYRPAFERVFSGEVPWVGCQYPTPALAQDAGMSTDEFEEFLFGAVLLDWEAERERMQRYADRFDAAEQVRIVGEETDLTLNLAGRSMKVDAGGANIPGGEFFGCPVEDSAEGVITFSEFPAVYAGREIPRIRLRFEAGRVVEATADANEEFLVDTLDSDDGARRLGELGIGCNPGITRYMKNVAFDEKIDGTVHLALGNSIQELGGTNHSNIHWDIVKDLRLPGSRIELDGEIVQQDGRWLL